MGVPFEKAVDRIKDALEVFDTDPRVRSIGIARHGEGFGFRAVRNSSEILPFSLSTEAFPGAIEGVPLTFTDTPSEVESLLRLPGSGPGSPAAATTVPEVNRHRPLVCGLQIQNFDDDDRQGHPAQGFITIGTLGCFVRTMGGDVAILSNNHVVAGENRGVRGSNRILQPGSTVHDPNDQIAVLTEYIDIVPSPFGATPAAGNVNFNEVDAGIATLDNGVPFKQGYLSFRGLTAPSGVAKARPGDRVFKVGRTTGLTFGEVIDVATVVGPITYDLGPGGVGRPCWFRRSITIEGLNGTQFSDRGDSGSAIVRTNGEVVGLLYAGNGQQTYACAIGDVFSSLNCSLI